MNNHNNRKTMIIPQTIIVPTKAIIVASLVYNQDFCLSLCKGQAEFAYSSKCHPPVKHISPGNQTGLIQYNTLLL